MIPGYLKIILWVLLVSSVLIAAYLIRLRTRAQQQLATVPSAAPMSAPAQAPSVQATLMLANDDDGVLSPVQEKLALPTEATTRAKTLLNDLFEVYAQPDSKHPLVALPAVRDVFLAPLPGADSNPVVQPGGKVLAVVNLNGAFVAQHPSGILVETLTLLSVLGTLRANLPQIAQVRFLVDGQVKETLAGHVDLTGTYLTANDVPQATTPGVAGAVQQAANPPRAAEQQP